MQECRRQKARVKNNTLAPLRGLDKEKSHPRSNCGGDYGCGDSPLAEKEGFEPSMSYQPIHEFQSCAINRARRLLHYQRLYYYITFFLPCQ